MDFYNKNVWITGASSGIGREMAIQLSVLGANLLLTARNEEALEETRSLCASASRHKVLALDLNEYHESDKWVESAIEAMGRIDVLVNNAGVSQRGKVLNTGIEVDESLMQINYFAPVALAKSLMPHFIEHRYGYYVNVASVAGKIGAPRRTSYSASKHALIGFFDSFRNEMHPYGIKVTNLCPGYVQTPIAKNALNENNEPANENDPDNDLGLNVTHAVSKMVRAMEKQTPEVLIANGKPWLGYHLRRLVPNLFHWLLPRIAPVKP